MLQHQADTAINRWENEGGAALQPLPFNYTRRDVEQAVSGASAAARPPPGRKKPVDKEHP